MNLKYIKVLIIVIIVIVIKNNLSQFKGAICGIKNYLAIILAWQANVIN